MLGLSRLRRGDRVLLKVCWLPGLDSNQGQGIQSPLCYHYTTGHRYLETTKP